MIKSKVGDNHAVPVVSDHNGMQEKRELQGNITKQTSSFVKNALYIKTSSTLKVLIYGIRYCLSQPVLKINYFYSNILLVFFYSSNSSSA